jgi:hypothetical protein
MLSSLITHSTAKRLCGIACLIITLFAAGCATVPQGLRPYNSNEKSFELFPRGATLYLSLDVTQSRVLVDALLPFVLNIDATQKQILKKTKHINAAIYRDGNLFALHGRSYPAAGGALALGASSAWEKGKGVFGTYWKTKNDSNEKLHLLISKKLILISTFKQSQGIPSGFISGASLSVTEKIKPPPSYTEYRNPLLFAWVEDEKALSYILAKLQLPITLPAQKLSAVIIKEAAEYSVTFIIELPSAAIARSTALMINMAQSILNATASGTTLTVKSVPLSEEKFLELLYAFVS